MELLKKENPIKNKRYSLIIFLGIFLLLLGISYNIYNHYQQKKQDSVDNEKVEEFFEIKEEKDIVDKTSASNNVNKNIYTLKETTLPDEQINSHIILAGHSGNSYISFFKNLKKLDIKDRINFYYKGVKYIYEVSTRYEIEKTGTTNLKITNKSDITLITCISGTNKQVVYVGNLVDKENY